MSTVPVESGRPLALRSKIGYGVGELGVAACEFFVRVYLLKLYVDVVGVPASTAGMVLAIAVVWDAFTDPIVGSISDRSQSSAGRRRPWIAVGAILTAVFFVVLFAPPAGGASWFKAGYLLVAYILFNTALTVISVPHAALGGEISPEPNVRNEVFGWRFLFANLGLAMAILIPAITSGTQDLGSGAVLIAGATVLSGFVCFRATRGLDSPSPPTNPIPARRILGSIRGVLGTKPFVPLLAAFVVGSTALTLNSSLALFYYQYRLQLAERDVFVWIFLPFAFVIAVSIGGWVLLSRRFGRRLTAFTGVFLLGVGTAVFYPLFPPGHLVGPMIWGLFGGVFVGSVFLFDAAVADVVDWDEVRGGTHREGAFFGVWRMASKVARAVGLAMTGWLLEAIGFEAGATEQTTDTSLGLALSFGPGVGVLFMASALIWLCFPIRSAEQKKINRILTRRRGSITRRAME